MKEFDYVKYEPQDDGSIVRIILNRPEARNAQNRGLLVELDEAFLAAEADGNKPFVANPGSKRDIDLLERIQPVDLIKFGLIPEFIGRLPVVGILEDLDKSALMQILVKPKNAIVKQYQRLFEFENVRLRFSDDALEAIAELAMERKVGARGLRMILEDLMLDLMYYLPSYKKVREFLVTKEMVMTQKISLALLEKAG